MMNLLRIGIPSIALAVASALFVVVTLGCWMEISTRSAPVQPTPAGPLIVIIGSSKL